MLEAKILFDLADTTKSGQISWKQLYAALLSRHQQKLKSEDAITTTGPAAAEPVAPTISDNMANKAAARRQLGPASSALKGFGLQNLSPLQWRS